MTDYYYPPALPLTSSEQTQCDDPRVYSDVSPVPQSHWAQQAQAGEYYTTKSHSVYPTVSPIFTAHDEYQYEAGAAQDAYVQPPIYVNTESYSSYQQPKMSSYEEHWMYQEQEPQTCDNGQTVVMNSSGFLYHNGSTYAVADGPTYVVNDEVSYDTPSSDFGSSPTSEPYVADYGSQMVSSPTSVEFEYPYQTEEYAEVPHSPVEDRRASITQQTVNVNSYPMPIVACGDSHALPHPRVEEEELEIPHMIVPSQQPLVDFKNAMRRQSQQYEEPVTMHQPYQQPPNAMYVDGRACHSDVPYLVESSSCSAHHPYASAVQSPYIDDATDRHSWPHAQHYCAATAHQTWSGQQPPAAQSAASFTGGELSKALVETNPQPIIKAEAQRTSIPSHSRQHSQPQLQAPPPPPPPSSQQQAVPQPPLPHRQPSPSRHTHSSQAHLPLASRYRKVTSSSSARHATHRNSSPPRRLSPLLASKRIPERKPPLACIFCRGRKIACGPPPPGSTEKTCNQCARRHLICEFPLESRRGMRKPKSLPDSLIDGPKTMLKIARR